MQGHQSKLKCSLLGSSLDGRSYECICYNGANGYNDVELGTW